MPIDRWATLRGKPLRWWMKNTNEKLEELRERLDEVLGKITALEKRLDDTDARVEADIDQGKLG
jgi:predicted nuclease with TOPRIM domain